MNLIHCDHPIHGVELANKWCERAFKNSQNIFLPAGGTPEALYKVWTEKKPNYLDGKKFYQVDDILNGPRKGEFWRFFETHLPHHVKQLVSVEAKMTTQPEIALLGLGVNGHVAFHEPKLPDNFSYGCVELESETRFYLGLPEGTWGVTYGLQSFLKCREILIMVFGAHKREVLQRLLNQDETLPAAKLMKHANLTIIADQAALGAIAA